MASKDTAIRVLCKSLGKEYRVCTIDFEPVIYRDFGNGFNVEISGVYTTSKTKKATLYLWYGEEQPECLIVKTVRDVQRDEIVDVVEGLLHYSYALLSDGFDARDRLSGRQIKITNCMNGGAVMNAGGSFGTSADSLQSFHSAKMKTYQSGK